MPASRSSPKTSPASLPKHAWFEDRGETCTLLAFVDDATSRLMQLRFVASESAFDYFRATRAYLKTHGKPVAFYSDKHGIFRTLLDAGDGPTALNLPGYKVHPLTGNRKGQWAAWVTGNCRLPFKFEAGHATNVDLEDYH